MKKIFISFLIAITLICNFPINVYASSAIPNIDISVMTDHEVDQAISLVLPALLHKACGIVFSRDLLNISDYMSIWNDLLVTRDLIQESESLEDFIRRSATGNIDDGITFNDEAMDTIYNTTLQYIEENSPFWVYETGSTSRMLQYYSTSFTKKSFYDSLVNYFKTADSREYFYFSGFNPISYTYDDGTVGQCFKFYKFNLDNCSIVGKVENYGYAKFFLYDSNWESLTYDCTLVTAYDNGDIIETDTTLSALEVYPLGECTYKRDYSTYYRYYYWIYAGAPTVFDEQYTPYAVNQRMFLSYDTVSFRVYNSLDDMKKYSLNQRPYYVTEKFVNYDSSVDNSTTITQTEIDNSITYGDVYNYITNNYENPDGLTEDELRAILEEYLSQIGGGSGGGGSGGGSDDDDDGGGGLSGFLDGLGAIGNAILSILGKLMEILGSAIELVTGSITDLITIIPNSIGELLGALFPVFPEEWIKAITLSLVLGVIVGIVRIFK